MGNLAGYPVSGITAGYPLSSFLTNQISIRCIPYFVHYSIDHDVLVGFMLLKDEALFLWSLIATGTGNYQLLFCYLGQGCPYRRRCSRSHD
jgi:hypothetical protein